jgi:hypothetical protein
MKHQFSSYRYFERNNIPKLYVITFIILSIAMIVCGKLFNIHDWITHPQFTEAQVTRKWFYDNTSFSQQLIFTLFFIFDFVWAFLLLFFVLGNYVKSKAKQHNIKYLYVAFIILTSLAYTFDCIENFYYLWHKEYEETIVEVKIALYAITFITVLLLMLRYSLKNRVVIIKEFISSAWISLLFLVIIGLSLPKAPQLNSIIVDLYYHPFWFVFVLLLGFAPVYCIVLSHYPTYFLLSGANRKFQDKEWRMSKIFWVFGIVWFKNKSIPEGEKEKISAEEKAKSIAFESDLSFLRRILGIFFYAALFYMVAYTADTNFGFNVELSGFVNLLIIVLIVWLYVLKNKKDELRMFYKNGLHNAGDPAQDLYIVDDEEPETTKNPINTYLLLLVITILVHLVLFGLLLWMKHPYNYTTVVLSLVCITLQAFTYTYYRTFRTLFNYAFFNDKIDAIFNSFPSMYNSEDTRSRDEKKAEIVAMFEKHNYFGRSKLFEKLSKIRINQLSLGALANNVIFLKTISYLGAANLLFLVYLNFFATTAMHVNAVIIILSAFFVLYGVIVVIIKHFIYYNLSKEKFAEKNGPKFFFTIYASVIVLLIFNFLARSNNLFELEQIAETVKTETPIKDNVKIETVNLKKYVDNLPDKRYYIGCYGGGMKANAWTMTVLNELDTNNSLYDKTVCLSGASGGTIGLINYSAIKHYHDNKSTRDSIIRKIGTENILSMDLTHLLGRDWFLHLLVPGDLKGLDRSTAAMHTYAKYVNDSLTDSEFENTSYRQLWQKMYHNRTQHFPILISNTTNIKGRQGMAVSIPVAHEKAKEVLYLGADDILELNDDKTLSFYNAASTTNRFPLISPAATIEGKGQFNDGGIYENSGLLSAYKLYEAINEIDSEAKDKETVFINIINDKSAYVKFMMQKKMDSCNGGIINKSSEISAILNSVAATEMFPGYIKDKLRFLVKKAADNNQKLTFENIYLPHKFDMDDVRAIYGQKFENLKCVDQIADMIEENNKHIKSLVKGCLKETNTIIEPEMSRVMAIPAFDFMEYMLQHDSVKTVLDRLR